MEPLYYEEEQELVYSPFVPFLTKKQSIGGFDLAEETPLHKRKASRQMSPKTQKKVHIQEPEESQASITAHHSDQECSEHYPEGELDRLIHSIGQEQFKIPYIPTTREITEHWARLKPAYTNSEAQEQFLSLYLNKDRMLQIQYGVDEEIVKGEETAQFQNWVENICKKDNSKVLKELARRQKVQRYLEKKHGRTYFKKVHYQIRQRVAEERLRVKGRFVTWSQALEMLNESNKKQYNINDYYLIKKKLKEKFGSSKSRL